MKWILYLLTVLVPVFVSVFMSIFNFVLVSIFVSVLESMRLLIYCTNSHCIQCMSLFQYYCHLIWLSYADNRMNWGPKAEREKNYIQKTPKYQMNKMNERKMKKPCRKILIQFVVCTRFGIAPKIIVHRPNAEWLKVEYVICYAMPCISMCFLCAFQF